MTLIDSGKIEIRTLPASNLYSYEASGAQNLKDVVIHNISIINNLDYPVQVQSVILGALTGGTCIQTKIINSNELNGIAQYLHGAKQQGVIDALDFIFRPDLLYGPTKTLSPSAQLEPGQSLFLPNNTLLIPSSCEKILVKVNASHDGHPIESVIDLAVSEYKQKNNYCNLKQ